MDQIKIGMFIADLRKEQGMTQKQLAESVGVSDKTISKWECGNGLPELSTIPELCKVLNINMNELLSGERLAEEVYSLKAEENMMTLIKETEVHRKRNKTSFVLLIVCLIGIIVTMLLTLSFGIGYSAFIAFLDMVSFVMLVIPAVLVLVASGLITHFFKAFAMLGKNKQYTEVQWKNSIRAVRLGATSLLLIGGVESLATMILLLALYRQGMAVEQFIANAAVGLLCFLYGLVAYLLLLPIRYKLEVEME